MATYFAKSSTSVSPHFIWEVRRLHAVASDEIAKRCISMDRIAGKPTPLERRTEHALTAYILAHAAVEAFLNETFLSGFADMILGPLPGGGSDYESSDVTTTLERLDLLTKIIFLPHVRFGRSLNRGHQPYQDMALLAQLRNELVHYKMGYKPPPAVNQLARRGIAFVVSPEQEAAGPHPWADRVSTLEGLRWANNTACATAKALLGLIPEDKRSRLESLASNFQMIE